MIKIINKNKLFLFLIIILVGAIIRLYQINFNDFWSDEMVSYWLAEPNISFSETIQRIYSSNLMILFEILLKYFHIIFGYDVNHSRYFSFILSFFSLIFFSILLSKISNLKSALLGTFILSINIYHIGYSVELRSYILTFLLVTLFIYFIFEKKKTKSDNFYLRIFLINCLGVLMILSHPFTLIVIGSYVIFCLLKFLKRGKMDKNTLKIILSLCVISLLFLIYYLKNTLTALSGTGVMSGLSQNWIPQIDLAFFSNFYFSKFFGSRILGLIHLAVLIFCIIKFWKKLIFDFDIYMFFLILLFLSYFVPLIYGFFFNPILIDRYIFFVLIPIICLISNFVFKIESNKIKVFVLVVVCLGSFLNNLLYETSFKKFYTEVYPSKPQIKNTLQKIDKSEIKKFTFKEDNRYAINTNLIIKNYLFKSIENLSLNINYFSYDKITKDKPNIIWMIYLKDTRVEEFKIPEELTNYKIKERIYFNRVELYMLSV